MKSISGKKFVKCIICGKKFGKDINPSKEHIIPEALGNEKIYTYSVCVVCNNLLGTHVDSYLTDYFVTRLIRMMNLEKDKNIQIFDNVMINERGEKYKIRLDGARTISKILEIDGNHVKIKTSPEEGNAFVKKVLRKKYHLKDDEIDRIMSTPNNMIITEKHDYPGTFSQDISLDKSKYSLAAIKMAYEYACEKFGESYLHDEVAKTLQRFLYTAIYENKECSDKDYAVIRCYCHMGGVSEDVQQYFGFPEMRNIMEQTRYFISITYDSEGKMLCYIRILNEDLLSFIVLLSNDGKKYLKNKDCVFSIISNDNQLLES